MSKPDKNINNFKVFSYHSVVWWMLDKKELGILHKCLVQLFQLY